MNITEKDILALKEEATDIRDQIISAKSTLVNVTQNIDNYKKELQELGIEPDDDINLKIKEIESEITETFQKSQNVILEWKAKMV